MEQLTANLSCAKVQRRTVHGREFLVAPITIIRPQVLNGSKGPLYYPADEIAKDHQAWNGMPMLVLHSVKDGKSVSGRDPDVFERQGIGYVYNSRITRDGRQVVDGYFDAELTRKIENRIYQKLLRREPIGVSTGLYTTNEPRQGVDEKGRSYSFVAREYKPDHLAILVDQPGACSIEDGCGVLLNQRNRTQTKGELRMTPEQKKEIVDGLISNCDCGWSEDDRETLSKFSDERLTKMDEHRRTAVRNAELVANAEAMVKADEEVCNEDDEECKEKKKGMMMKKKEMMPGMMKNEQSVDEWLEGAPEAVQNAVRESMAVCERERQELIGNLTAHLPEKDREPVANALKDKPLTELRVLQALAAKRPTVNWSGSAGAPARGAPVRVAPLADPHSYAN